MSKVTVLVLLYFAVLMAQPYPSWTPSTFEVIGDTWWMSIGYSFTQQIAYLEKSTDFGKTWEIKFQISNDIEYTEIQEIDFVDENRGWIRSEDGTLLRTTDGGDTWIPIGYTIHAPTDTLRFINDSTGFLLGEQFLKTTDGGRNWQTHIFTADSNTYKAQEYSFVTDSIVFVSGWDKEYDWNGDYWYNILFKTIDQGNTWEVIRTRELGDAWPIFFFSSDSGYQFFGFNTELTTTGGATWDSLAPLPVYLYSGNGGGDIQFFNSQVGYFTSFIPDYDTLWKTTDGCKTWKPVPGAGMGRIYADGKTIVTVQRIDSLIRFCYSLDNGDTWQTAYYNYVLTEADPDILISEFKLYQNYPNPFNPSTTIKYSLPEQSNITIIIYDALGREIDKLVDEEKPTGEYEIKWNAENLPSGIYFCRMKAGNYMDTRKLILMK